MGWTPAPTERDGGFRGRGEQFGVRNWGNVPVLPPWGGKMAAEQTDEGVRFDAFSLISQPYG